MTPIELLQRLDRTRRALSAMGIVDVLCWAIAAGALLLGGGALLAAVTGRHASAVAWVVAAVTACAVGAWRWRRLRPDRVKRVDAALWIERQSPELRYALVTLAEQQPGGTGAPVVHRLAAFASTVNWEPPVRAALGLARLRAGARLLLALAAIAVAAAPWPIRGVSARNAAARPLGTPTSSSPTGRVVAQAMLLPPAYSGRAERTIQFGETLSALVGSLVRIDGEGDATRAALLVQESSDSGVAAERRVATAPRGSGWRAGIRIGRSPLAVRLRDAVGERWILITPVPDSAPVATITRPTSDTLVLDTAAVIRVAGTVHDDIALRDARIEYIISSGGGEQFTFRSGTIAPRRGALGRDVTLDASLDLGALKLKSGDMMHVRLTAHDGNTLSGPSAGSSETRTIRIPRRDERDTVSVEQLPPTPVDTSVISQRQLLLLTRRLLARIPSIPRTTMLAESQRIGRDQARLRKQVSDIVFARLGDNPSGEHAHFAGDGHDHNAAELAAQSTPESVLKAADAATGNANTMLDSHGDETPVVAVNRPLLEAYNAMWDATRALQGGEPRNAIDPMKRALAAIQRARAAERLYLRGTPPAAVVDIAKIRLIGTDTAAFEQRRALDALPPSGRRIAQRVLATLAMFADRDTASLDSLRLLRLDALGAAPQLATALGDAITAVEQRRDATDALLRARRVALAPWQRSGTNSLWLGGPP